MAGPVTASFFLDGKFMGTSLCETYFGRHGELRHPESVAFACPNTGEVWFRRVIPGRRWGFHIWPRNTSYRPENPPGSVWITWDPAWNETLPLPVLLREVELHAEHALKMKEV